jgi:iron complex outermembrane receptor protein
MIAFLFTPLQPRRPVAAAVLLLLAGGAAAQAPASATQTVVVTATRTEAAAFNLPAAVDRIDGSELREGRFQVNISEGLAAVPGLLARDRQNFAQDVQISVRGFGARSTFGIRGVRLYVDGIPATLPDGQGQLSNVDLASVDRIEVLRGPASALYGNASGGVLQVFTEEGQGAPRLSLDAAAGSDSAWRVGVKARGAEGGLGYVVSASQFETDGYREHSAVRRRLGNVKLSWQLAEGRRLTLLANSVTMPRAQDPLGLTRAQFEANPRGVDASANSFDTRKTVSQTQAGLVFEQALGEGHALRAMVYGGHRNTVQFQAIPVATQASALHPGGVIQLGRDYAGADLRWAYQARSAAGPLSVVAGFSYDTLQEERVGRQNFIGSTLGVAGALRRDESNDARNADPYVQASLKPLPELTLQAGLRRNSVRFKSQDHYVQGSNPDDSGSVRYAATLPVLGALWSLNEALNVYASWGRGFETPTLNELAYRADGGTGMNFALRPAGSRTLELGLKWRDARWGELRGAVFHTRTHDEIVTYSNSGGRSTFRNAGDTTRRGLELGWALAFNDAWRAQAAYTWLDARYDSGFLTCAATPCTTPNLLIAPGRRIPGIARTAFAGSLAWQPASGPRAGIEWRALSRVDVNDTNSDAAGGFGTASAQVGWLWQAGPALSLQAFARVDNLFARRYAGSVIVNEGNSRFFEPAAGRTGLLGVNLTVAL